MVPSTRPEMMDLPTAPHNTLQSTNIAGLTIFHNNTCLQMVPIPLQLVDERNLYDPNPSWKKIRTGDLSLMLEACNPVEGKHIRYIFIILSDMKSYMSSIYC